MAKERLGSIFLATTMSDEDLRRAAEANEEEEGSGSDEIDEKALVEFAVSGPAQSIARAIPSESMKDMINDLADHAEHMSVTEILPAMTNVFATSIKTIVGAAKEGRFELPEVRDDGTPEASMQKLYNATVTSLLKTIVGDLCPAPPPPSAPTVTVVDCEEVD